MTSRHRLLVALSLLVLALSIVGLSRFSRRARPGPAASASAKPRAPSLPPLSAESWLVDLGSGVAAVPLGAREPRPVWIALHGGEDRAEWACGTWTGISRSRAFVVCPRGKLLGGSGSEARFGWGTTAEVEAELRAALKALKGRFGAHVAPGPVVVAAFAAGVKQALELSRREPKFFTRLVLVGAEPGSWSAGQAAVYAKSGAERALFVVSDPASRDPASTYWLFARGAGLETKLLDLGDRGLVLDAEVAGRVGAELDWIVGGDPRYAP